jgi:hypothetical protein
MIRPLESKARELISRLDQEKLAAIVHLLERMVSVTDPLTEEDRSRLERGLPYFAAGKGIPMEQVLADFGLTLEDFPSAK